MDFPYSSATVEPGNTLTPAPPRSTTSHPACQCDPEVAGAIATAEEHDENAPLRNMAPLAVRVPRLPVRRPEAHPALRTAYDTLIAHMATVEGVGPGAWIVRGWW